MRIASATSGDVDNLSTNLSERRRGISSELSRDHMVQKLGGNATAQEHTLLETDCFKMVQQKSFLKSFVNQTLISKKHRKSTTHCMRN